MIISKTHTSCKNCIFAVYNNNTQVSCKLRELDLLRRNKVSILEAYDEEKEFYIINNTKCLKYRSKNWKYADQEFVEQVTQVLKEIELKYHAIIIANNSLVELEATLISLINQTLPPKYLTIIRPVDCELKPSEIYSLIQQYSIPNWKIENLMTKLTQEESIDIVVQFSKAPVYAVFQSGYIVRQNVFGKLNNKIHREFFPFVIITPDKNGNGLIVSQKIHERYHGNSNDLLQNKLKNDECPHIYPFSILLN